eukprot:2645880-Rhodomonas_salina.1
MSTHTQGALRARVKPSRNPQYHTHQQNRRRCQYALYWAQGQANKRLPDTISAVLIYICVSKLRGKYYYLYQSPKMIPVPVVLDSEFAERRLSTASTMGQIASAFQAAYDFHSHHHGASSMGHGRISGLYGARVQFYNTFQLEGVGGLGALPLQKWLYRYAELYCCIQAQGYRTSCTTAQSPALQPAPVLGQGNGVLTDFEGCALVSSELSFLFAGAAASSSSAACLDSVISTPQAQPQWLRFPQVFVLSKGFRARAGKGLPCTCRQGAS